MITDLVNQVKELKIQVGLQSQSIIRAFQDTCVRYDMKRLKGNISSDTKTTFVDQGWFIFYKSVKFILMVENNYLCSIACKLLQVCNSYESESTFVSTNLLHFISIDINLFGFAQCTCQTLLQHSTDNWQEVCTAWGSRQIKIPYLPLVC